MEISLMCTRDRTVFKSLVKHKIKCPTCGRVFRAKLDRDNFGLATIKYETADHKLEIVEPEKAMEILNNTTLADFLEARD